MSKPNAQVSFVDIRFRGARREHASSTFLGYADATLRVSVGDASVLDLRIRGIELKVLNGRFRVDFKSEQGSDGKWYPLVFPKTAETREILTHAMLAAYREHLAEQEKLTA